jgi:carbon starvation protein
LGLIWFFIAYRTYGSFIEKRIVKPDDSRPTPAHTLNDNVDYVPAKKRFLWGNHFASIAGAGPIIGPILAVSIFGWGYTVLWVVIGAVFLGAVHDYLSLMFSVRHDGLEIDELAGAVVGRTMKLIFAALLWIVLLFIVAVFLVSVAQAFIHMPQLVIPTLGLIGISLVMGLAINYLHVNDVIASCIAVVVAYLLIWVGSVCPVSLPASWRPELIVSFWVFILCIYCLLASISPMWLILRPRDFVSSVMLTVGMGLGFIGIVVVNPNFSAPFSKSGFISSGEPVWPILFIMVACGAISGFHSIVATGTSSRQLNKESDGKAVAFGGMLMEGVVALLVIMIVSAGLKWGFAPKGIEGIQANQYFGTALSKNWIVAFSQGFGNVVGSVGIPYMTVTAAALLGAVMVKSFILTTLDSGSRLARYIVTESFSRSAPIFKNKIFSTVLILIPAFLLAVTKSYHHIWKLFGSSNQLIAAVALVTITAYLARAGQSKRYTLIPSIFMLVTTVAALLWQIFNPGSGYFTGPKPDIVLGVLALVLIVLALTIVIKTVKSMMQPHQIVKPSTSMSYLKEAKRGRAPK